MLFLFCQHFIDFTRLPIQVVLEIAHKQQHDNSEHKHDNNEHKQCALSHTTHLMVQLVRSFEANENSNRLSFRD